MGVSSITTFVESTSGAADGGRTGLTSVTTGVLFILAAFFSPIVTIVSSAATCGALVYVGYLMMSEASEIDWSDVSQGFPAFMIVAGVPFTYSISAGIGLGFIAYVIVALFKGEASKIKPLMWIAALAFLVYFFRALLLKPGNARTRDILLPKFWTFCPPNGTTAGYILQICWA